MCDLCTAHELKIGQFERALSYSTDDLSINRLQHALATLRAWQRPCDVKTASQSKIDSENAEVASLQLHKIDKALAALSVREISDLVEEIESKLPKHSDEL